MSSGQPYPGAMTTDRDSGRTADGARDESPGDAAGPPAATGAAGADSDPPAATRPGPGGGAGAALVFDDPLDRPSADDTDRGWGDSASGASDDDFTRFLNEKPPHHL